MSSSPLSYAGAGRRVWDATGGRPAASYGLAGAIARVVLGCIAVLFAWCVVTLWYGLLLPVLPVVALWRLTRRGARRERAAYLAAERRHRELLAQQERVDAHADDARRQLETARELLESRTPSSAMRPPTGGAAPGGRRA